MGQPILLRETLPAFVALYEGQARLLGMLLRPKSLKPCNYCNQEQFWVAGLIWSRLRNRDRLH